MAQTIDIVIPHRNRRQALQRALRSVCPNAGISTIIVVDDFSDEDQIPAGSELHMPGSSTAVRFIRNGSRMGAQHSRARGIMESRSDWIAFLDSDDEFIPGMLEQLRLFIAGLPKDMDLVYGDHFYGNKYVGVRVLNGFCYKEILKDLSLAPFSGLCARRSVIPVDALDLDLPTWQDDDFILEMSKVGKVTHIGCPIARLNTGVDRISGNRQAQYKGLQRLLSKWSKEIRFTHGCFAMLLWKQRLRRVKALALSDNAGRILRDTSTPMPRRVWAVAEFVASGAAALLLYIILRPFFSRIYI